MPHGRDGGAGLPLRAFARHRRHEPGRAYSAVGPAPSWPAPARSHVTWAQRSSSHLKYSYAKCGRRRNQLEVAGEVLGSWAERRRQVDPQDPDRRMHPQSGTARVLGTDVNATTRHAGAHPASASRRRTSTTLCRPRRTCASSPACSASGASDTARCVPRRLADRARDRRSTRRDAQRLMVARALVNTPTCCSLDEPTTAWTRVSSGDPAPDQGGAARGAAVLLTRTTMHEADEFRSGSVHQRGPLYPRHAGSAQAPPRPRSARSGRQTASGRAARRPGRRRRGRGAAPALGAPELVTVHTEEATLRRSFTR